MIVRNRLIEAELVKQLPLVLDAPPHHVRPPRESRPEDGITLAGCLQPTFATWSNGAAALLGVRYDRLPSVRRRATMAYFAGLDVSMKETHICVVDGDGGVVLETRTATLPEAIAAALRAPSCQRVVLETGRMAPTLFHGLEALGVPVVCIESRQAYQALKSLATHKTDRNDARGLAQLARTGFFKPVHVKSLAAHAIRALIIARKKLVGQRVTLENQIRGLAVVFAVRLPRGLSPAFETQVISGRKGGA